MIRIVHISDLHFCASARRVGPQAYLRYVLDKRSLPAKPVAAAVAAARATFMPSSHDPDLSYFAAKFICENLGDHDVILITGDLATTGMPPDINVASAYVSQPAKSVGSYLSPSNAPTLLSDPTLPIIFLPGNHDRFEDDAGACGSTNFDNAFKNVWAAGRNGIEIFPLTNSDTMERLFLISADFCLSSDQHSSPIGWPARCGQGLAYNNIVSDMVYKSNQIRGAYPEAGIIWVSHFPPAPQAAGFCGSLELLNHSAVIKGALQAGIEFILAGHIHEKISFDVGGVKIICAGAACTYAEKQGNWIHSLAFNVKGGQVSLTDEAHYRWNEVAADFILQPLSF